MWIRHDLELAFPSLIAASGVVPVEVAIEVHEAREGVETVADADGREQLRLSSQREIEEAKGGYKAKREQKARDNQGELCPADKREVEEERSAVLLRPREILLGKARVEGKAVAKPEPMLAESRLSQVRSLLLIISVMGYFDLTCEEAQRIIHLTLSRDERTGQFL